MARKRYSDEDVLKLLREIDVHLHDGLDVVSACRKAGISDKSYYYWRKKFGGLSRSQVSEIKSLKKENERLKKIVADLQLDKVILKERLTALLRLTRVRRTSHRWRLVNRPLLQHPQRPQGPRQIDPQGEP